MIRLRTNIFTGIVSRAWSVVIAIIFVPVYLAFIGIESYGLIGITMAVQTIIIRLGAGIRATLSREIAVTDENNLEEGSSKDIYSTFMLVFYIAGNIFQNAESCYLERGRNIMV